ncbi:MAG: glucosamine-6-phosphate deaminase [Eubacteriales bacterium]|nr:glucosamine-6-phosphate deaminase [Eubacteriales bacterium]
MVKIIVANDYEEMSKKAAAIIAAQVIYKADSILGLATGSSPIGIYDYLTKWYQEGSLDFSQITTVNLDEYRGIEKKNDQSYDYFMHHHFFDRVNVRPEKTFLPNGMAADVEEECARYQKLIDDLGGIDLQLLGIGHNGHIGFNEPGESLEANVHCVSLSEKTIEANKRFFASAEDVPKQAYTMGMRSIMEAKKIVIVANGEGKAEAIAKAFAGKITTKVPASLLQLHPDVTVVVDQAAASLLPSYMQ